jgi:hypothetical protein
MQRPSFQVGPGAGAEVAISSWLLIQLAIEYLIGDRMLGFRTTSPFSYRIDAS